MRQLPDRSAGFRREAFTPHLGSPFAVLQDDGRQIVVLVLDEVTDTSTAQKEGFSLRFVGPSTPLLAHDTHCVSHPAFGEFLLFLGPVLGGNGGHVHYQAVFSRPR